MEEKTYNRIAKQIRSSRHGVSFVNWMDKVIVMATVLIYGAMILVQFIDGDYDLLYKIILVPAVGFLVVSACRYIYNQPRPYEVMDIDPIIVKDTKGKSFPSRHVYSIFVIAMTALQINMAFGILLLVVGFMLATLRVIGGVHYTRDVFAGAFLGIITGVIGYYIILR